MDVIYLRSDRRSVALEVTPELRVLVRLPLHFPQRRAEQFVAEHRDWIDRQIVRQQERNARLTPPPAEIERLRQKAKEYIPGRVEYFSRLTGLIPTGVGITSAKTRFGSCSGKNRLNFSLYLMQYSAGAVDYVVLHEICHIRYKNHGKEFYALIARYMPDYQKYVKELRK